MPHDAPKTDRLALAASMLDLAVPLNIAHLRELDGGAYAATRQRWIAEAEPAGVFSEVLPAGGKQGEAVQAVGALARCLAALAFVPGGVTFADRHYEARPANEMPTTDTEGQVTT